MMFSEARGFGWMLLRARGRVVVLLAAAALLAVGVAGEASGIPARASARCQSPTAQPPNVGRALNFLNDVAVTSGCKAWAVGFYRKGFGGASANLQTLVEYWNGKHWKVQPSPNPSGSHHDNSLESVAAISPTNAWAVGSSCTGIDCVHPRSKAIGKNRTTILHWNGKDWKVQPSPNPGDSSRGGSSHNNHLLGVAATSSTNAWAVGYSHHGIKEDQTILEHWDGKAWKVQPSSIRGGLYGIAATSSNSAWAVGGLIEHWNGKVWKVQPSPDPRRYGVYSVAATSPTNAWAVGGYCKRNFCGTAIEHWNGRAWKLQKSPSRGSGSLLDSVTATSPTNAWAVGTWGESRTLIEHWNGKAWKIQKSPNLPRGGSNHFIFTSLNGVAATGSTNAWAVGFYTPRHGRGRTLALHWNGTAWSP